MENNNKIIKINEKPYNFDCTENFKGSYSVKHEWGDECEIQTYPFTVIATDKHNEDTKDSLFTVEVVWDKEIPFDSRTVEHSIRLEFMNSLKDGGL